MRHYNFFVIDPILEHQKKKNQILIIRNAVLPGHKETLYNPQWFISIVNLSMQYPGTFLFSGDFYFKYINLPMLLP